MHTLSRLTAAVALVLGVTALSGHATVFFNRQDLAIVHGWVEGTLPTNDLTGQQTYTNAAWRAKMLTQFPQADRNGDGTLTEAEAIQYHMSRVRMFTPQGREEEFVPATASRWFEKVPMRDGVELPTEILLPGGQGPWPVVLCRSSRGRIDSAFDYGNEILRYGYAFVGQDLTPEGDSFNADLLGRPVGDRQPSREEVASLRARQSSRDRGQDGYDAVEWIAKQPWCNGNIAMTGYSEGSGQTKTTLANNPPHLTGIVTSIGTLSRGSHGPVGLRSGARMRGGGEIPDLPDTWSPPGAANESGPFRSGPSDALVKTAPEITAFVNDRDGWFDFAVQGSIDEWNALRPNGRAVLIMGIGGHGALNPEGRMAPAYGDADIFMREIKAFEALRDTPAPKSVMYYFLMGDATDPDAPGKVWKQTEVWPPPHTDTSWYLTGDGGLTSNAPAGKASTLSYTYDPRNPVRTMGGARMPANLNGPLDQSHLSNRTDMLRFYSAPLAAPIEISGPGTVELYVSTDVPDTAFIVTLLDVYPDGYEWPIRDSGIMARYHAGLDEPEKLEPGKVYKLTIPLVSTALMLNKGHRLGLTVTSSSFPTYEVHPNTWDAIESYDDAAIAHNTVHVSPEYPSRVIVPEVAPGVSQDYVPTAAE